MKTLLFHFALIFLFIRINAQQNRSALQELVGNTISFADSNRLLAPWLPPQGKLRVIIDADAANEVDDQFAITLALGFPERFQIEGFVASHYGLRGGRQGIENSAKIIEEVIAKAGKKGKFPIKKGTEPLTFFDRGEKTKGVDFIIEKAKSATRENPLWVIALGPATNVAAAYLKDTSIAGKMVVLWHGRTSWPRQCWNFNAYNDIKAVQVLFDLPLRFLLFDTGTYLTMPMEESEKRIQPLGTSGKYLHQIREASPYARQPDKGIFDLGDIAVLIDPGIAKWEIVDIPTVNHDLSYDFSHKRGKFVRIYDIDRDACFKLLIKALIDINKGI